MKKLRVNILCLIGAFAGLFAILLPWYSGLFSSAGLLDIIRMYTGYLGGLSSTYTLMAIGAIIFVIGTLITFLTPTGGFVQIVGLGIFLYVVLPIPYGMPDGIGFYLGYFSIIMILAGMLAGKMMTIRLTEPISIGYDGRPPSMRDRLLTFSTRVEQDMPLYPQPQYFQPMPHQQAYYPQQPTNYPQQPPMRSCVTCVRAIPWDAVICPYCGHDYRQPQPPPQ